MTRICFIGDSHLGAVKLGWDLLRPDYPHAEATFFGAGRNAWVNMAVANGRLFGTTDRIKRAFGVTSGGQTEVVIGEYDIIVLVGLNYSLWTVLSLYATHRSDDHKNPTGTAEPVSTAFFNEVSKYRLASTIAITLQDEIVRVARGSKIPVWISPQAMPSASVLSSQKSASLLMAIREAVQWRDDVSLGATFSGATAALRRQGRLILDQPEQTRESEILTAAIYSADSVRLTKGFTVKHDDDDFQHMNGDYGAAVLRRLFSQAGL